jgi:dienelactone hydrolase
MRSSRRLHFLAVAALCGVLTLASAAARAADEEAARIGGVDVVVWMPSTGDRDKLAVVLFSHALWLCPAQSRYLTAMLADAGYLVIAPRHIDSSCGPPAWPSLSRMSLKPSPLWTDEDYRDRADDIKAVVIGLPDDERYRGMADLGRLGLVGHSLGGYTVLGLGGAWPSWRLPGVRAVIALTPYSLPFQQSVGLSRISVPVMYQIGGLDPVFSVPLEHSGYAHTRAPKILVAFAASGHLAWTDLGMSDRDGIIGYTLAFLDHHVRGAPEAPALHAALPGVSSLLRD